MKAACVLALLVAVSCAESVRVGHGISGNVVYELDYAPESGSWSLQAEFGMDKLLKLSAATLPAEKLVTALVMGGYVAFDTMVPTGGLIRSRQVTSEPLPVIEQEDFRDLSLSPSGQTLFLLVKEGVWSCRMTKDQIDLRSCDHVFAGEVAEGSNGDAVDDRSFTFVQGTTGQLITVTVDGKNTTDAAPHGCRRVDSLWVRGKSNVMCCWTEKKMEACHVTVDGSNTTNVKISDTTLQFTAAWFSPLASPTAVLFAGTQPSSLYQWDWTSNKQAVLASSPHSLPWADFSTL